MKTKWIPLELVLIIHDQQLAEHGGSEGLRDKGALESALARPQNLRAYRKKTSLFELAASYAVGISKNYPFVDGNKRTALVVTMTFLELNGFESKAEEETLAIVFEQLAEGTLKEQQLSRWLEQYSVGMKKAPQKVMK